MSHLSKVEIEAILVSGDFAPLKGTHESETLECKAAPYQLDHEHQKLELAKDISALANAKGGIILVGINTERDVSRPGFDEIKDFSPFENVLVDPERYHSVLKDWIYPSLQSVQIEWHPSKADQSKGIFSITVPAQTQTRWPFLITKVIDDRGRKRELVFGYAERRRANAEPASVEEIHRMIRDGATYGSMEQKLEVIQDMIENLRSSKAPESSTPDTQLDGRIGLVLSELELGPKHPTYILAVAPKQHLEVISIFSSRESAVAGLIENPPRPRTRGFDIGVGEAPRIVSGERLRSLSKKSMAMNLWRDGTLVFAVDGDDFLCRGRPMAAAGSPLRINPLALIESTYSFCALAKQIYEHVSPRAGRLMFRLEVRNMTINNMFAGLTPGPLNSFEYKFGTNIHRAPASQKIITQEWQGQDFRPGEVAFKLLSALYAWFEFEEDKIPYAERDGESRVISPEEIRRLNP
jgi:hypothetical protein